MASPSFTENAQLVQPGEWPGVSRAVSVTSPTVTLSPSRTVRSTFTGGNASAVSSSRARIIAAFEQRFVGFARDELAAAGLLHFGKAAGVIDMGVGVERGI